LTYWCFDGDGGRLMMQSQGTRDGEMKRGGTAGGLSWPNLALWLWVIAMTASYLYQFRFLLLALR
jgi:hypothetical protein